MTNQSTSVVGTGSQKFGEDTMLCNSFLDTPAVQASCCLRILTENPQQALNMDKVLRPFLKHLDPQRQYVCVTDSSALLSPDPGPAQNASADQMAIAVPDVNKYFLKQNIRNWLINAQARANIDAIDSMMDGMFGGDTATPTTTDNHCCHCQWERDELSGVPLTTPAIALVLHLRENSPLPPTKATSLLQEPPWRFHHKIELSNTRGGKHRCKARQEFYCSQSPQMLMSISSVHFGEEVLRITIFTRSFHKMVEFYRSLLGINATFIRDNFCLFIIESSNEMTFQLALKFSPKLNSIPSKNCFLKINSKAPMATFSYVLNEKSVYPVDKHCLVCDPDGNLVLIAQADAAVISTPTVCTSEVQEEFIIPAVSVECGKPSVNDEKPASTPDEADGVVPEENCDMMVTESWQVAEAHRHWEDALLAKADNGAESKVVKTNKPETKTCLEQELAQTFKKRNTVYETSCNQPNNTNDIVSKDQPQQNTVVYESLGEKQSVSRETSVEESRTFAEFVHLDDVLKDSKTPKNFRNDKSRASLRETRSFSNKFLSGGAREEDKIGTNETKRPSSFNDFRDELRQAIAIRTDCLAVDRRCAKSIEERATLQKDELDKLNSRRMKCLALDRESLTKKETRIIKEEQAGELIRRNSFRSSCLALENEINRNKSDQKNKEDLELPQYNYRPSSFLTFDAGRDNKLRCMAREKDEARGRSGMMNQHGRRASCSDVQRLTSSMCLAGRNCACARCREGLGHGTDSVDGGLGERRAQTSLGINRYTSASGVRNISMSSDNLASQRSHSDALHKSAEISITTWGSWGSMDADAPAPQVPVKQASCTNLSDSIHDVGKHGVTRHSCGYLYGNEVVDATDLDIKQDGDKSSGSVLCGDICTTGQGDGGDGDSLDEISDQFPDLDSVCGPETPRPESQFSGSESQYPLSEPMWSDRSSMDSGRHTLEPGSSSETERDPLANMQDILLTAYTMDTERQQSANVQQSYLRAKHKIESKGFKFRNKKTKTRAPAAIAQKSEDLLWYNSSDKSGQVQTRCRPAEQKQMVTIHEKQCRDKTFTQGGTRTLKPWECGQSEYQGDTGRLT